MRNVERGIGVRLFEVIFIYLFICMRYAQCGTRYRCEIVLSYFHLFVYMHAVCAMWNAV